MKIKNNNGVIGVDIGVAITIFIIFVSVITMLFYNTAMSNIATERKATATDIAVKVIEDIKIMEYDTFKSNINEETGKLTYDSTHIKEGYTLKVLVTEAKEPDLLREITVKVTYKYKNNDENVEIKTLKSYM